MTGFYTIGGTLHHDSPAYVEREADKQLRSVLTAGEFAYVLTSRQMGKSSLMVRTTQELSKQDIKVVVLDFTAVGQNVSPEQWYDGLLLGVGRKLDLEDELEDYWMDNQRISPVQRWFGAIREVALAKLDQPIVIFCDEIDVVKSLPFRTDEFFAAIRECYNRRIHDSAFSRLNFCLLGVATPAQLISDPSATPFNVGNRIPLRDFTFSEAQPLARGLTPPGHEETDSKALLERILYWTHGHPYLTQKLCRRTAEDIASNETPDQSPTERVDALCEETFLTTRAREQDDNLLFVRDMILRNARDLGSLLERFSQIQMGDKIMDDEADDICNHLILSGIVRIDDDCLVVRNRIYNEVFNQDWVTKVKPVAEVEMPDGKRIRIKHAATIGRTESNDIALPNPRVSRRHAVIQSQSSNELWLVDLGSRNGIFINGKRVTQPSLLRDRDLISLGPFQLTFIQPNAPRLDGGSQTTMDRTVID